MPLVLRALLAALLLALVGARPLPADDAADQYAVAAGHYAQGRWQMACDEFQSLLRDHPADARSAQANFYCGEALAQLGRSDEAVQRFDRLIADFPASRFVRQAMFRRAEALYVSGQHKRARTLLEEFRTKYPDDDFDQYVLVYLGELLLDEQEAEAAQKLFAQVLERFGQGELVDQCRLGMAKAHEQLGKLDAARADLRKLAAGQGPWSEQAQLQLGLLENAAGEYEAALAALQPYEGHLADSPHQAAAQLERGWALYKLHRNPEAEAVFQRLAEHDAASFEPRYWLGMVLAAERRWDAAIAEFSAVESNSTNPARVMQCRAALALCYVHADRRDDARRAYAAFESSQPGAELWNSTTYQLAEAAFAHDSLWASDLFRALAREGNDPAYAAKGLSGLAWCQFRSEDTAGSVATFERLIREYPEDPSAAEAALVRGQALEKLGQPDPALSMYELVIEKYPRSRQLPEALWKAARLQQRMARAEQAEVLYRRLSEERPPFAHYDALLFHWSQVLEELGRGDEAEQLIERLRRDWPSSPLALEAMYRLAERALARKDYDHAAALLREIEGADPPAKILPQALFLHGRLGIQRTAWDEVCPPLERLVHDFPSSPLVLPAQYWLAEAAYRQKQFERAASALAQLDRDATGHTEKWLPRVPLRQAQALAQLGQWPEALSVAQSIASRFPDFDEQFEADYLIGRALANQADFALAREAYGRVLRSPTGGKSETAAMAQWMIGETFFHQESYEAAIAAYLRVEILFAYPHWQAGALLQAGKCQEHLGRWKDAAETYARLVQTYPDTEYTDEAKRRLSLAQQKSSGKRS